MTGLAIRPAQRSSAKPLIGFYSESGGGKTFGALVVARGFVGPSGKIVMIETEGGRGESYADPAEYPEIAGYEVISLRDEFHPKRYFEAIQIAEKAKPAALIIDSASHEWEAVGGVLDMAAQNIAAGKKSVLVWQQPKMDHQRFFILPLLATPIPLVIVNMRAKYPMVERKKPDGTKEWYRSETLEPKQSEDILSEIFTHGWFDQQHNFHLTQCRSRTQAAIFDKVAPLSNATGEALARWATGAAAPATASVPSTHAEKPAAALNDTWGKHGTPAKWGTALTTAINSAGDQAIFDGLRARALPSLPAYKEWNESKYEALMELINAKQLELLNR